MARLNMEGLNRWQKMSVALLDSACESVDRRAAIELVEDAQARYDASTPRYMQALRDLAAFGIFEVVTFPNPHVPRGVIDLYVLNASDPMKLRAVWTGEYDPV